MKFLTNKRDKNALETMYCVGEVMTSNAVLGKGESISLLFIQLFCFTNLIFFSKLDLAELEYLCKSQNVSYTWVTK